MPIAILNAKTSGKFHRENIAGASYIVTTMMPIRGGTAMNGIFYPDNEVTNAFMQLQEMLAPSGHPSAGGVGLSAASPIAINNHHIGASLRNPRKKGKRVFVDYIINEKVAAQSEDGQETVRRIEAGEKLGVSTGLNINILVNKSGKDDFGKEYTREGRGFEFDHVATLLNEAAAGEHAGTELILNSKGVMEECVTGTVTTNELTSRDLHEALSDLVRPMSDTAWSWIRDIFLDSQLVIFDVEHRGQSDKTFRQAYEVSPEDEVSLVGMPEEGTVKQVFEPVASQESGTPVVNSTTQEGDDMDKTKLVLAIIANSSRYSPADQTRLEAMTESAMAAELVRATTVDEAKEVLNTAGVDLTGLQAFTDSAEDFKLFQNSQKAEGDKLIAEIVTNSEYTAENLADKSLADLTQLHALATRTKVAVKVTNGQKPAAPASDQKPAVDTSI